MGQIRGIREEGKKRGRKGAADVRLDMCLFFYTIVIICENGTGKSVRKEQK